MPTFLDALDSLSAQAQLITALSSPFPSDLPSEPIGGLSPSTVASYRYTHPEGGPFTRAYLRGNESILETIREAHDHERRLFKFIGVRNVNGGSGGGGMTTSDGAGKGGAGKGATTDGSLRSTATNSKANGKDTIHTANASNTNPSSFSGKTFKIVEKRSKGLVTPVRKAGLAGYLAPGTAAAAISADGSRTTQNKSDGWNDPEVLLKTALTLVDEYRPMPRTRQHIINLLEQYSQTQDSIVHLQREIEDLSHGAENSPSRPGNKQPSLSLLSARSGSTDEAITNPEDWFKQEEEALAILEAQVTEKRKQKRIAFSRQAASTLNMNGMDDDLLATSPIKSPIRSTSGSGRLLMRSTRTPDSKFSGLGATSRSPSLSSPLTPKQTAATTTSTPSRRGMHAIMTPGTINKDTARSVSLSQSQNRNLAASVSGHASSASGPLLSSTSRKAGAGLGKSFLGKRLMERNAAAAAKREEQELERSAAKALRSPSTPLRPASEEIVERSPSGSGPRLASVTFTATTPSGSSLAPMNTLDASMNGNDTPHSANTHGIVTSLAAATSNHEEHTSDEIFGTVPLPSDGLAAEQVSLAPPVGVTAEPAEDKGSPSEKTQGEPAAVPSPTKSVSGHQRKNVEGIEIRSEVRTAATKIWSTLGDILRSGEVGHVSTLDVSSASETIKLIAQLAQSDPAPPLSPSSVSTLSTVQPGAGGIPPASGPKSQPLNQLGIMTCNMLMELLKAPGFSVTMNELKESLTAVADRKGWDKGLGTRAIYNGVAKRAIAIDRKAGNGGAVTFAI